eukprot:Ihof_evm4s289 gene=Ihof_evmTU4s289
MDFSSVRQSVTEGLREATEGIRGATEGVREAIGIESREPEQAESGTLLGGIREEVDQMVTLTRMQRLYGFGICFGIGLLFSVLSIVSLMMIKIKSFTILYSLGNILSIGSTFFLVGPMSHLKTMCVKDRAVASAVVFISIGLTLMAGLWWRSGILALIFVLVQLAAMFWYSLSYIPYG